MTKSTLQPKTQFQGLNSEVTKESSHLPDVLAERVQKGKYVTEKDKERERVETEERDAKRIVKIMKDVEPFGDIPDGTL